MKTLDGLVYAATTYPEAYSHDVVMLARAVKQLKEAAEPVTYQPCARHRGMSMVFRCTTTVVRAPVCPGCHPPPNLVRDSDVPPLA